MSPQERLEFERMKRDLENIKRATDVAFVSELSRRLAGGTFTISPGSISGTTIGVRNATDTGTTTVAGEYDGVIVLRDANGNTYRLGFYT